MAYLNTVLDMLDQFKLTAASELEKYHKLFVYDTVDDFSVVLVPTEESEMQLINWYITNKRPNSRLTPVTADEVVDDIITASVIDYHTKCGCTWVKC